MKKKYFKNELGDFHIGLVAIDESFKECFFDEIIVTKDNTFYRCTVCNDLFVGLIPPLECPTCGEKDAYCKISYDEFIKLVKIWK